MRGLGNVLKIKPPAVISEAQADRVLDVFEKLLVRNVTKKRTLHQLKAGREEAL
jgi:acetylornithine/succinyldiaminopimelate/putrescine aminotransferase